jgi:hypothetical protein
VGPTCRFLHLHHVGVPHPWMNGHRVDSSSTRCNCWATYGISMANKNFGNSHKQGTLARSGSGIRQQILPLGTWLRNVDDVPKNWGSAVCLLPTNIVPPNLAQVCLSVATLADHMRAYGNIHTYIRWNPLVRCYPFFSTVGQ